MHARQAYVAGSAAACARWAKSKQQGLPSQCCALLGAGQCEPLPTCEAEVTLRAVRAEDVVASGAGERRADGDAAAPTAVPLARARKQLELAGVVEAETGAARRGAQRWVQGKLCGVVHCTLADL